MTQRADVAIIGGGIVGLAHARAAAQRGHSVVLFEREAAARGASVRNFGMIWPIGQPAGELHQRALRSRACWLELGEQAGLHVHPCGSLHLAYRTDELAVLTEFAERAPRLGYECQLLGPREAEQKAPAIRSGGLLGALWSATELCVDPREAVARLPHWLAEKYGVQLRFGTAVTHVQMPEVVTATGERWQVQRAVVCGGADFETLFPEVFRGSGIRRCKLQMLRTPPQPGGWRLGPHIAGGLTLTHYAAFQGCPSLRLLRHRLEAELPEYLRLGIHVMAAQNHLGEVVLGDSHEYDADIEPFDKPRIDELILSYARGLINLPDWTLHQRWHGIYAKHPTQALVTYEPQPHCHIMAAPGGTGMTLSFAWTDDLWQQWEPGR